MCCTLRELERQIFGCSDVLAVSDVLEPALLDSAFIGIALKPGVLERMWDFVTVEKMSRELAELLFCPIGFGVPRLDRPDPIGVVDRLL